MSDLCWIVLADAGSKKTSIGIRDVRAVALVVMRVAVLKEYCIKTLLSLMYTYSDILMKRALNQN
jgi:hypothetical protein